MTQLKTPVVLFVFKRTEKTLQIIDRISKVKPQKIYIISDQGRNEEEKKIVKECRQLIEKKIDWDCELILNYALENRGVYENIGEGAKWVLKREKNAIFLEDDNLPEESFFKYCEDMLEKYENEEKILWICGTNYLRDSTKSYEFSYYYTKHLLPCGWASWSTKFLKYYDGNLNTISINDKLKFKKLKRKYENKKLYKQQKNSLISELKRKLNNEKFNSWDYQMAYSIRINDLYGISPVVNQIENIGVDENSIHGGNSFDDEMTKRFCGIKTSPLDFPLNSPKEICIDEDYEEKIGNIILYPLKIRMKNNIVSLLKILFNVDSNKSIRSIFRR